MSELEPNNLMRESRSTSLSKSGNITQEQECNELKSESDITAPESDSISIWKIGKITSKIAGWISGIISDISLLTVAEVIKRSRKGEWDRKIYDYYFGKVGAISCTVSGLISYGAFKLAKYFDSKAKN